MATDVQMKIQYINPIAEKMTGWMGKRTVGLPVFSVFPITDHYKMERINPIEHCLSQNSMVQGNNAVLHRRDGKAFNIDYSASPVCSHNDATIGAIMIIKDVSEQKEAQKRANFLAHYDSLTALPNRTLFRDCLESAIVCAKEQKRQLAVLILDMDHFKSINDTLGHDIGDTLILEVAARIKECCQEQDIVARLGGDEFSVLMENIAGDQEVEGAARKILRELEGPFKIAGFELLLSVSIGIARFPQDAQDSEGLLRFADRAMYLAKDAGRDTFRFYSVQEDRMDLDRLTFASSLRHALEKEEFYLNYQPKLRLKDKSIVGAEALLRWTTEGQPVAPSQFIPLLEESGLILEVGEWVLRQAVKQAKEWTSAGFGPFIMSVNLSPRQFRQQNLVETVFAILDDIGLEPKCLELELTESILIEPGAAARLVELKARGIQISIDDFGTGYSSLSYLHKFPIDTLKIDRSFVQDININPDENAIIQAIIAMAHSLKLKAIAEGVETEEQLAFLQKVGCDEIQGYWLSRPMNASDFTLWQTGFKSSGQTC